MYKKVLILIIMLLATSAYAEEKKEKIDAEEMGKLVHQMYLKMAAPFTDPVIADMEAQYIKNKYDALISKGFTKEQALTIVVNHGTPIGPQCSE